MEAGLIIDLIRKVVPIKVRQNLGLWTIAFASRSPLLLYPYLWLLLGHVPMRVRLLPHNQCSIEYAGNTITAPRDGILAFFEIFRECIYERYWSPRHGDIVLDVGAYVGMFTVRASVAVGAKGTVIAVEPGPDNFRWLWLNALGLRNVAISRYALSDHDGNGVLHLSGASPCHTLLQSNSSTTSVPVDVRTIDSLMVEMSLTRIDFIKIDAEGSELRILLGADKALRAGARLAIAAYHLKGGDVGVANYLQQQYGYKCVIERGYVYAEKETA